MEYKGSITIFMSLTILMVMALMFSLIEAVHFRGCSLSADNVSKIGIESAFAEFNRPLWEEYGILAIDAGYGAEELNISKLEARVAEIVDDNINPNPENISSETGKYLLGKSNFLRENVYEVDLFEYGLLSDGGGAAAIKQAAKSVMASIPENLISAWQGTYESSKDSKLDESEIEKIITDSNTSLDEGKQAAHEAAEAGEGEEPGELPEGFVNPIDLALGWKDKAILGQVIKDLSTVSTASMNTQNPPSKRSLERGNAKNEDVSVVDRILFSQYLKQRMSSYTNPKDTKGLSYKWEYIINGKNTDTGNLESTVVKLLGLREAQNLISIYSDPVKVAEALGIATTICTVTLTPYLIEVVKLGIIAAWAYLESVLDVRLLLSGGRVPLIKTPVEWTSGLLNFPSYMDVSVTAKNSEMGMDYSDYLCLMTMIMTDSSVGMRFLDVLEDSLRGEEYYGQIRIDNFIFCGKMEFSYDVTPVFAAIIPMMGQMLENYKFVRKEELSYI